MRKDRVVADVLGGEVTLTPSDFYNAQFKRSAMGGYDRDAVDQFMSRAGDVFEAMVQQLRQAKQECETLRAQMNKVHELENSLQDALEKANTVQQRLAEAAHREADAIIEQARAKHARIEAQATELPAELKGEIETLRAVRDRLRAELRAVLATHNALLAEITPAERRIERNAALYTPKPAAAESGDRAADAAAQPAEAETA